ncbi:CCA tRNA nucleotidyltransferase [Bacillus sp. REN10]|uniref:CCA tRNA nucleotidyltransferase n=1 Tax=Bacillus sp. REN10 TaxID=2782541 RepID=UPI00193BE57B|nr:CCA tRNA nucleotidyltransferase [Bacillus sp. REN10]
MKNEDMFQQAAPLLIQLEQAGFEAYYVGGAVRDYVLKRPIGDVDIATSALPEEVKNVFPKTVDVGIEHGTVLVLWKGVGYEVTTFRTESDYKDYRHPETVSFVRSLTEDLQRRDFTMNAMAMDQSGRIIDPFNGQQALAHKQIQTVGEASERFSEDALRMMRAARFVSQLGFGLHEETAAALKKHAPLLQYIAVERKLNEIEKLFAGAYKNSGILVLLEAGLHTYLPGMMEQEKALEQLLSFSLDHLTSHQTWLLLLKLLNHPSPKTFLSEWRMPAQKVKYLTGALQLLYRRETEAWSDFFLYEAGSEAAIDVETVHALLHDREAKAEELGERYARLAIQQLSELAVSGKDLLSWKREKGGPWMKQYLSAIERAVVEGKVENSKEQIKEWLKSCNLL